MKNKAHDIATYSFQKGEPLLLDTNVWLYICPAPSDTSKVHTAGYVAAFKKMLSAGCCLAMDAIILSEYLNRYCRIEWNALHKQTYRDFKAFRNTGAFQAIAQKAATFARSMLKLCTCHDHPFATTDIARVLADFEAGSNDFNDGLLVETCRHYNWKLVTNDSDCVHGGIDVLTTNPKLLTACP